MAIRSIGGKRGRVFARTTEKEDGRYTGTQLGYVSTTDQNEYLVSYLEAGFRCDHIVEPLMRRGQSTVSPQSVDHPLEYDQDIVGQIPSDDKAAA